MSKNLRSYGATGGAIDSSAHLATAIADAITEGAGGYTHPITGRDCDVVQIPFDSGSPAGAGTNIVRLSQIIGATDVAVLIDPRVQLFYYGSHADAGMFTSVGAVGTVDGFAIDRLGTTGGSGDTAGRYVVNLDWRQYTTAVLGAGADTTFDNTSNFIVFPGGKWDNWFVDNYWILQSDKLDGTGAPVTVTTEKPAIYFAGANATAAATTVQFGTPTTGGGGQGIPYGWAVIGINGYNGRVDGGGHPLSKAYNTKSYGALAVRREATANITAFDSFNSWGNDGKGATSFVAHGFVITNCHDYNLIAQSCESGIVLAGTLSNCGATTGCLNSGMTAQLRNTAKGGGANTYGWTQGQSWYFISGWPNAGFTVNGIGWDQTGPGFLKQSDPTNFGGDTTVVCPMPPGGGGGGPPPPPPPPPPDGDTPNLGLILAADDSAFDETPIYQNFETIDAGVGSVEQLDQDELVSDANLPAGIAWTDLGMTVTFAAGRPNQLVHARAILSFANTGGSDVGIEAQVLLDAAAIGNGLTMPARVTVPAGATETLVVEAIVPAPDTGSHTFTVQATKVAAVATAVAAVGHRTVAAIELPQTTLACWWAY